MFSKSEIHEILILMFFAFLGGLTRELNDLVSSKINVKNFAIGIITAVTTGAILGQLLIGSKVTGSLAYGLSGLAGFVGPHLLFILSKGLEKKIEQYLGIRCSKNKYEKD